MIKMKIAAAATAVVCAMASCATESAASRMDRSKLLIGAYSWKKAACDEAHVRDVKECGIDFIVGVDVRDRTTLDLFAKHGVGVIGNCALSGWWGGDGSNAGKMRLQRPRAMYEAQLATYLEKYDHPAIWKIALCDEPSALDLPYLGEVCDMIAARVPQAPAYLNLYPNYASVSTATGAQTRNQLGTATYREHIDVYCRTVPLDYISYDFYVYTPNRKRRPSLYRQMYDNFNIVADACRRTGRSFWYIPQVNSHNAADFEPTTENRLRFQAYSAMAFGAEAISWACWMPGWWTNNVLTASGEKTAQYDRLKAVNAELRRLGPIYMRYRSTATHYVGFAATNGLETLGMPLLDSFVNGFFMGLETRESTPLLIGEMTPRGKDDGSRALFVVASGDPFDYAPAMRTVAFRIPKMRAVSAFGGHGPVALTREADDMFSLRLAENDAVMLVSEPRPSPPSRGNPSAARNHAADAQARQSKMTDRDGKEVLVMQPRVTEIVRAKAGATVDVTVDGGAESVPMAFAGAGKIVKKGAGTLVIGPGEGTAPVSGFAIEGGDVLVRGGRMPAIDVLRAGECWKVEEHPETQPTSPEGVVAAGMRISRRVGGGKGVVKGGDGTLTAHGIGKDVERVTVSGGTLRLAPHEAGSDAAAEKDLIANPGFENRGADWRKYVHDDGKTYVTQFSNPGFTYSTSSWAFGYTIIDGLYCGRLHNNGGFSTTVEFPSPGRYRLTLHMRSRTDSAANPTLAFVKLADGSRLEIFRMTPPLTLNFIEHSFVFDMPECGKRELVITGLGLGPDAKIARKDGRIAADISTMVDGVHLVKEAGAKATLPAHQPVFAAGSAIEIEDGARLAIEIPGTNRVASLRLGGKRVSGLVSSATHPAYISGTGMLDVRPYRPLAAPLSEESAAARRSMGDHMLSGKVHVVSAVEGYNSWPMIQAVGSRLVCGYSRDNALPKDGHGISAGSRDSYMRYSLDGGITWSKEIAVAADPDIGEVNEGIGLDEAGAALLWVRCWGRDRRHELYRTVDGSAAEKVATVRLDPFPMQIMDVVRVEGLGLVSPWFAGNYRKGGANSWGLLVSADNGHTWTQRVIEDGLSVKEWVTEPSLVDLGGGRLLIVGRCEQGLGTQFQVTSDDCGKTWKKSRTNIADVRESTPSLLYDAKSATIANYYYHRGARKLKRRVASADFIFGNPGSWPEPEVLDEGFEPRAWDAGNVKATRFGDTDCCAWYTGTQSNATVVVTIVPKPKR